MKRIITSALCLAMALSMSIPVFATSDSMKIRYTNQESYEIYIPDSMDLDASTGKGMFTIEVDETEMSENSYISVTATSENYDNGWFLVNVDDENDKIEYFIGTSDSESDVTADSEIMAADGSTSVSFYITLSNTNKFGTYEDTVTFTSEVKDSSMLRKIILEKDRYTTEYATQFGIPVEWNPSSANVNVSDIVVTSSNNNIFTVDYDYRENEIWVWPLTSGTAIVTISVGDISTSCEVTVNPK